MKKYWRRLSLSVQKQLTYRFRILLYILLDLSAFFIFPFLWLNVFQDKILVGGYSKESLITYYVVAAFVSLLSSSHSASFVFDDIRTGRLSQKLVLPLNYFISHFSGEGGYRVVSFLFSIPLFITILFFFPDYILFPQHWYTPAFFLLSLFLAWILSALFQYIVGLCTFWLGETGFAFQIRWFLEKIFSGELAPLPLLPLILQQIAVYLPFRFLFFFPIQIYLEQLTLPMILSDFAQMIVWILLLCGIVSVMWKKGLRRYDGSGI